MSIGPRVRRLRLESELTQRQLAASAGVGVAYLSRLENGRLSPSARTLTKIAKALGTSAAGLYAGQQSLEPGDQCPVTQSGRCVLEFPYAVPGRPSQAQGYSREDLDTLRRVDALLQSADADSRAALIRVVQSLSPEETRDICRPAVKLAVLK